MEGPASELDVTAEIDLDQAQADWVTEPGSPEIDYIRNLFARMDLDRMECSPAERQWLRKHRNDLKAPNASWSQLVPRLPNVVPRLMAATRDPDQGSARELADLIASDPVLAANLMKVVNSAAMRRRPEPIQSLEQAVVIAGISGVREAVGAAFISPIANFKADARLKSKAVHELWPDTLGVAVKLREGAERSGLSQGFELFFSGITHSVGLMLLLRRLDLLDESSISPAFANELELLSRHYSVAAAAGWELPSGTMDLLSAWAEGRETALTYLLNRAIGSVRRASLAQQADRD